MVDYLCFRSEIGDPLCDLLPFINLDFAISLRKEIVVFSALEHRLSLSYSLLLGLAVLILVALPRFHLN